MLQDKETKNFGAYLDRTLKKVRLDLGRRFKELNLDITPEQWIILSSLSNKNGQSQTQLGEGSFKNAPTVSRIIDLLCKKGLTERRRFENDRRRYKVFLTKRGKAIVEKAVLAVNASRKKGWNGLTDEDYTVFLRIINQIFDNFEDVE